MQLSLDAESATPLVDQIVSGIRVLIDDRVWRPAMRLPAIRAFAAAHRVSRFTTVEAYDRLVALGYLQSRRGSGFYVAARPDGTAPGPRGGGDEHAFDNAAAFYQSLDDSGARLKVGAGWLPPDWFDDAEVHRNMRALTRRASTQLLAYGPLRGYLPLREQLRIVLGEIGIAAPPAQIVLTHGATQALDLVARALLKPGDCVFVDDPGYWNLFANLRLYGVQLVGVPRTADGPDADALETLLGEHRPKVFFTQSVLQNPTACSLSPATAFRVLQLAERHDLLIVEDDVYADLHPGAATRLAQLDQLRRVIYVGSYSKTLSANLRVGFLACSSELAARLTDVKIISGISTSEFSENLVYLMLTEGRYRKIVERTRDRLARAIDASARRLERAGLRVYAQPAGGMFVWAALPDRDDSQQLASAAAQAGIMLAPGQLFRPQMQASPYLRINVAYALDARFERFERFLGDTLGR